MRFTRGRAGLLVASLVVAAPAFAAGAGRLTQQERATLRAPEQAAQAATDKVNAARATLERARRDPAAQTDPLIRMRLTRAAHQLARAEHALAAGHYHAAYVLARRLDALRVDAVEVEQ